jgi:hypothetical protein
MLSCGSIAIAKSMSKCFFPVANKFKNVIVGMAEAVWIENLNLKKLRGQPN